MRSSLPVRFVMFFGVMVVGACGSGAAPVTQRGDAPSETGTVSFCTAWEDAVSSGDDATLRRVLDQAPSELAGDAALLREAEDDRPGPNSAAVDEAAARLTRWVEVNCHPDTGTERADAADRRLAPPVGSTPDGLAVCSAGRVPAYPAGEEGVGMVLYGETGRDDPYTGPMLGVMWSPDDGHAGDGDPTPVRVRGTDGVAAPISVFQQVVLPDVGTVVAWEEEGLEVGLYGRGWALSRADELVALADNLVFDVAARTFALPEGARPAGYREVFAGSPTSMSVLIPPGPGYQVRYQPSVDEAGGGIVTLSATVASAPEAEAYRFLGIDTRRETLDGRPAVAGSLWHAGEGPWVESWREPDGLTVRIVGMGVEEGAVRQVAAATRELSRDEWTAVVDSAEDCFRSP